MCPIFCLILYYKKLGNDTMAKQSKYTDEQKIKLYDDLLFKLGYAMIGGKDEKIGEILTFIRYSYCYPQMNSSEGDDRSFTEIMDGIFTRMEKLGE